MKNCKNSLIHSVSSILHVGLNKESLDGCAALELIKISNRYHDVLIKTENSIRNKRYGHKNL